MAPPHCGILAAKKSGQSSPSCFRGDYVMQLRESKIPRSRYDSVYLKYNEKNLYVVYGF